ncbi:DUF6265 family protein [Caenimonas aquaedulcis]|uniref:DUF6265 domain-containing protein n=1 Tax=Caenimonas aquaedulcis TaxID=2793270 RepID=A0A931H7Q0_9BURK|nr:DUF6265 family protein [Caenimonas aquaedulcis]MBG9389895.1 hypothetical protein [Caenimonas aquaedulcis]
MSAAQPSARRIVTAALIATCAAGSYAQSELSRVAWLAGCWRAADAEAGTEEHWMSPAGDSMLGMGRTVKQGRTVSHEFMQIRPGPGGALTFFAMPSGKPPDAFPVLRLGEREVVFENLQHEFPQRVMYRMESETRLAARIEGMRGGTLRGIDFPMDRVSCDARAAQSP